MKFVIGTSIIFTSGDGILRNTELPGTEVTLTTTACRVFVYLLDNAGKEISRDELLDAIWTQYGLAPSENSLNQYISIIRRGLAEVGSQSEIIHTIPKKGFIIEKELITKHAVAYYEKNRGLSIHYGVLNIITAVLVLISVIIFVHSNLTENKEDNINSLFEVDMIDGCEVLSLQKISEGDYRNIKPEIMRLTSRESGELVCEKDAFYLFTNEKGFIKNNYGRFFLSRCIKINGTVQNCDSFYQNKK